MQTVERNIGMNRGKPRLWIEGSTLVQAGLDHGNRWNLVKVPGGLNIVRDPDGKRKIAGKAGRPIIDICGAGLGDCAAMVRVKLIFEQGSGFIAVRNAEGSN